MNGCFVSQYRCGTLKNPHCSMAMSAEHWSKFAALQGNGDISIWMKEGQTNNLHRRGSRDLASPSLLNTSINKEQQCWLIIILWRLRHWKLIIIISLKTYFASFESILLKEETDFIEPQLLWNHAKSEIFVIWRICIVYCSS